MPASDSVDYQIEIERLPLLKAINRLAQQTPYSIVLDETARAPLVVGPLVGSFKIEAALQQLLLNTGLESVAINSRSYEVRRAPLVQGPSLPATASHGSNDACLPEQGIVTVCRTRISTARSAPSSVIIKAQELERLGANTVGDVLAYIPRQPYGLPESSVGDGSQYADLRGLGTDAGVVLLNGRWVPPSAASGVAFDLNTIPLTAVERIQVLHESAAAALGMRAIGGVINIELKRGQRAPMARVEYGASAGGGEQRQISLSTGSQGPRLSSSFSLDYFERDELPGAASEFWGNQDFRRYGGNDYRSQASSSGNIMSTSGAPLPGLPSSYAAVPIGIPNASPSISDFRNTAGQTTLESLRGHSSIIPETQRLSVAAHSEYSFDNVVAFLEVLGSNRITEHRFPAPALMGVRVPETNAFSPFDEAVLVSRLLTEVGPRQVVTDSRLLRVVAGLSGELSEWTWEVTALSSDEFASRWANNALNVERTTSALASSDPNLALNLFHGGPIASDELVSSIVAAPSTVGYVSRGAEIATLFHGSLFETSAGDARALLGAQWRKETTSSTRTVAIGHAELRVPLWTEALEASLSARADHFSDIGSVFTPNYSLMWRPFDSLELRAAYGTNFRAPSAYELFGLNYAMQVPIADRRRNGQVGNVIAYVGGSLALQPVSGKSAAVSARLTPGAGWEIGVNYWSTRVRNRIMAVPLSVALEHEDAYAERITRAPPTNEDLAAGRPGALQTIDLSTTNAGGVQASGIDADMSYAFDTSLGTFKAEIFATWMERFATFDVPGAEPMDRLGLANPRGSITRWRTFGAAHWLHRLASLSVVARNAAPYEDTIGNQPIGRQLRAQTWVDVQATLNLGEVTEGIAGLNGVRLTAGALNVFGARPQFAHAGGEMGYDPSLTDVKQEFVYARIEKRF